MSGNIDFIAYHEDKNEIHVSINGVIHIVDDVKSTREYVERICLDNGTTLDGCYEASYKKCKHSYCRPIFIGGLRSQVLIPIESYRKSQTTWLSFNYLLDHSERDFNILGYKEISEYVWNKRLVKSKVFNNLIFKKN